MGQKVDKFIEHKIVDPFVRPVDNFIEGTAKNLWHNKGKIAKHWADKGVGFITGGKMGHNKHVSKFVDTAKTAQHYYSEGKKAYTKGKEIYGKIPKSKDEVIRTVHGQTRALFNNKDVMRHTKEYLSHHTEKGIIPKHGFKRMFKNMSNDAGMYARKRKQDVIERATSEINKRYRTMKKGGRGGLI